MNVRGADMRCLSSRGVQAAGSCAPAQYRVDPQRQTHDESGDDRQSHGSSRLRVNPLLARSSAGLVRSQAITLAC
jgi:hypothetical protein